MIDHCVSAFDAYSRDEVLRVYVTDALKAISESVSGYLGGPYMQERYHDLLNGTTQEDLDADEIILDIIERAELKVGIEDDEYGLYESESQADA